MISTQDDLLSMKRADIMEASKMCSKRVRWDWQNTHDVNEKEMEAYVEQLRGDFKKAGEASLGLELSDSESSGTEKDLSKYEMEEARMEGTRGIWKSVENHFAGEGPDAEGGMVRGKRDTGEEEEQDESGSHRKEDDKEDNSGSDSEGNMEQEQDRDNDSCRA